MLAQVQLLTPDSVASFAAVARILDDLTQQDVTALAWHSYFKFCPFTLQLLPTPPGAVC